MSATICATWLANYSACMAAIPPGLEAARTVSDIQRSTASHDACKECRPCVTGVGTRPKAVVALDGVGCAVHALLQASRSFCEDTVPTNGVAHKHCINMVDLAARGAVAWTAAAVLRKSERRSPLEGGRRSQVRSVRASGSKIALSAGVRR